MTPPRHARERRYGRGALVAVIIGALVLSVAANIAAVLVVGGRS